MIQSVTPEWDGWRARYKRLLVCLLEVYILATSKVVTVTAAHCTGQDNKDCPVTWGI